MLEGPNALGSRGARRLTVLVGQLHNPLLLLLFAAALTSVLVGERTGALIIFAIGAVSIGLGFVNEYRSERAVEALHSQLRHTTLALRDGSKVRVDVTGLVSGDVVLVGVGDVVPADLRLMATEESSAHWLVARPVRDEDDRQLADVANDCVGDQA